jgi:chromosome segregation ATPase
LLRDLKKELAAITEQFEKVTRKASKLETEFKDTSQTLGNMTRDYTEVNLRLKTYEGSIEAVQKLNEEYRALMFSNEGIVAQ